MPRSARIAKYPGPLVMPTGSWTNASAILAGNDREGQMAESGVDVVQRKIALGGDYQNGMADITIERDSDFKKLVMKFDGKPIISCRADKDGVIALDVREQDGVVITGDVNGVSKEAELFDSAWLADEGTNWRKDDDQMVFTYPKTGQSLALPIVEPGMFTPKGTFPVYGQPEMVFSVVMGIAHNRHTILSGPTGTGKSTVYQFVAELLGYNFVRFQIDPKTEGASLVGEYLPAGTGTFEWTDGPLTEAVRLSNDHPTIFVFDELSRIGNVAELARTYSLLDDARRITLNERRHELGNPEVLNAGQLYIGATMNPADDEGADYIGVRDLDPALMSRFSFSPLIKYPTPDVEIRTLIGRVPGLSLSHAERMVDAGNAIRNSEEVHYPFSFRELIAWAEGIPYYGYIDAAKVAFINKAHAVYRPSLLSYAEMVNSPDN